MTFLFIINPALVVKPISRVFLATGSFLLQSTRQSLQTDIRARISSRCRKQHRRGSCCYACQGTRASVIYAHAHTSHLDYLRRLDNTECAYLSLYPAGRDVPSSYTDARDTRDNASIDIFPPTIIAAIERRRDDNLASREN